MALKILVEVILHQYQRSFWRCSHDKKPLFFFHRVCHSYNSIFLGHVDLQRKSPDFLLHLYVSIFRFGLQFHLCRSVCKWKEVICSCIVRGLRFHSCPVHHLCLFHGGRRLPANDRFFQWWGEYIKKPKKIQKRWMFLDFLLFKTILIRDTTLLMS